LLFISQTDKISLLGSTIDYVGHLQGRLKALQEEEHNRSSGCTADSPPLDARYCIGSGDGDGEASPKIKADVQGRTVLLRVVCREKKGVLIMVLKELEKHGLSIINTNVLPLAESSSLNITITAQVNHAIPMRYTSSVSNCRPFRFLRCINVIIYLGIYYILT
jgi:hypothetical protein